MLNKLIVSITLIISTFGSFLLAAPVVVDFSNNASILFFAEIDENNIATNSDLFNALSADLGVGVGDVGETIILYEIIGQEDDDAFILSPEVEIENNFNEISGNVYSVIAAGDGYFRILD